jgi:hypothetical protein
LALVWISHPSVGAWASVISAIVQGLRLLCRDFNWPAWRHALGGVLLFAVLGAYYFYSIVELAPPLARTSWRTETGMALGLLVMLAACRLLSGGTCRWWLVGLVATAGLGYANGLYFDCAVGVLAWTAAVCGGRRFCPRLAPASRSPELILLGLGMAALVVIHLSYSLPPAVAARGIGRQGFGELQRIFPGMLEPISATGTALSDLQLGYTLWAAAAVGCVAAFWRGRWDGRLFALALVGLAPLLLPIPGLSPLLELALPDWLFNLSTTVWFRLMPAFSFLIIFTSFLGTAAYSPRSSLARWLAGLGAAILIAGGLLWQTSEIAKLQWRGEDSVNTAEQTEGFYRTDSQQLHSTQYLPVPSYLLDGPVDYHFESRLLSATDLHWLPDPLLDAPGGREITLTTKPTSAAPELLQVAPVFPLAPGAREIWKFEFLDKKYEGLLAARGPGGFVRYYQLDSSGEPAQAFGVDRRRPKTLEVWNSQAEPQEVQLSFMLPSAQPDFGDFARVRILPYRTEDLQVQTLGLIPYVARVSLRAPTVLETPRVYIPGYRAKVDGHPVAVEVSPEHLVMVRLPPGNHEIEVSFRPSPKLALAGLISGCGWLALAIGGGCRLILRRPLPAS